MDPSDSDPLDVLLRRGSPERLRRERPFPADLGRPAVIAACVVVIALVAGALVVTGVFDRSDPSALPFAATGTAGGVPGDGSSASSDGLPSAGSAGASGSGGASEAPGSVEGSTSRSASADVGTTGGSGRSDSAEGSTGGSAEVVVVHVAGAVVSPGLVRLPGGGRVADAVERAGGARADADLDRLNLAAPLADGSRVFVPVVGQPEPAVAASAVSAGGGAAGGGSAIPTVPVDLNTATVEQLDALPGVGPSTAQAIVAYRDEHGRFATVEELEEVRGIGPAKLDGLRGLVSVS